MLVLHGHPRSGNTRKVRWALQELGLSYELGVIDLAKGEQRHADYLALNPNGTVPTLVDDGLVVWESDAILWHLATKHGALVPDPLAHGMQWMSWNAHHLGEVTYKARVYRMVSARTGSPFDPAHHASITRAAGPVLAILDAHLAKSSRVVGSALSIADLALAMNVTLGLEEGAVIEPFEHVRAWHRELAARPAYREVAG